MPRHANLIRKLSRCYGETLGQLAAADKAMEDVAGLDAYDAALAEVDRTKLKLQADLDHIAYVIKIFEPGWRRSSVKPIRPQAKQLNGRNVTVRLALDVLRAAIVPLTAREIADIVAKQPSCSSLTDDQKKRLAQNITTTLKKYAAAGLVVRFDERPPRWWLSRRESPPLD